MFFSEIAFNMGWSLKSDPGHLKLPSTGSHGPPTLKLNDIPDFTELKIQTHVFVATA